MERLWHTFICLPTCFHQLGDFSHHLGNGKSSQLTFTRSIIFQDARSTTNLDHETPHHFIIFSRKTTRDFTRNFMFFWDLLRCGEVIHPPRWKKVTALRLRFVMFYLWLVVEPPLWKIWKSYVLVGGWPTNHLEKSWSEFVNGKDDIP